MSKRMLVDGAHPEEIWVVTSGNRLDEYDIETSFKKQVKGNIYLAKVTSRTFIASCIRRFWWQPPWLSCF